MSTMAQWMAASGRSEEAELVQRARAGEAAAITVLYDRYHARVRAFARRLVDDAAAAEDLVHDVFVELPRVLRRLRAESRIEPFLLGVTVNHARHHIRAARRRREAAARFALEPVAMGPASPETAAVHSDLATALTEALDSLSVAHRSVFVLCEVEGLRSPEVAEILGVPDATVRTRLLHARRRLTELLARRGLP